MSDPGWWEQTTVTSLEQGDLLIGIPIYSVRGTIGDPQQAHVETEIGDAIIVTQTCDLDNDKIGQVLVAGVQQWATFAADQYAAGNTAVKSGQFHTNLIRGNLPPLTLLAASDDTIPTLAWSVADFRDLSIVQRSDVELHVTNTASRLRLRSPYKEHFAQAFARYFMRVGLPHDADDFLPYASSVPNG